MFAPVYVSIILIQDNSELDKYKEHIFDVYNPVFISIFIFILLLILTYVSFKFIYIPLLRKHKFEKENLELKNAKLLALFSELDPNPIIRIRPDGKIVGKNKSAAQLFNLENEEGVYINDILTNKLFDIDRQIFENKSTTFNDHITGKYYEISLHGISLLDMAQLYFYDLTEKKKYDEQMEVYQKLLRDSSANLLMVLEKERVRFASLLHDSISHNLLLIKLGMQNTLKEENNKLEKSEVGSTLDLLDSTIEEVKEIARNIRPVNLEELGLVTVLTSTCKNVSRESGIKLHLELPESKIRLNQDLEICLYRIAQEALNNIIKHSKATEFTLNLLIDDESTAMIISDNGIGFKPTLLMNKKYVSDGMGLMNMQERVERLSGAFYIDSSHNNGTVISVEFPNVGLANEK